MQRSYILVEVATTSLSISLGSFPLFNIDMFAQGGSEGRLVPAQQILFCKEGRHSTIEKRAISSYSFQSKPVPIRSSQFRCTDAWRDHERERSNRKHRSRVENGNESIFEHSTSACRIDRLFEAIGLPPFPCRAVQWGGWAVPGSPHYSIIQGGPRPIRPYNRATILIGAAGWPGWG